MSKIILIFESSNLELFLKNSVNDQDLIIAGNEEIKNQIIKLNLNCKLINEYSSNPTDQIKKGLTWIKNWPDKPILNGKSFKELLVYNEISIYWFLETRFYLYRIQGLILLIDQIQNLFSKEQQDSVLVKGNYDAYHIINEKFKIKLKSIKFDNNIILSPPLSKNSLSGHGNIKLILLKLFRTFPSFIVKSSNTKPVLIISELGNWRNEFDYVQKKYIKKDVIFSSIIKKLSESLVPMHIIDFENNFNRIFKSFFINKTRKKIFDTEVEPWEKYVSKKIIDKTKFYNKKLQYLWIDLQKSDDFKNSLVYDEISLYEILKDDFVELINSFKTYTSPAFIEASNEILDKIQPSVILMHDEYGTLQLCIIKEAAKRKIPTIAIQHGVNTETWISYVHNPNHINGENQNLNFPIPNYLCVWSQNAKSNLIKNGNFPSSVPVVTGDPKSDYLLKIIKNFDFTNIVSSLKIPRNYKIILFATQPLPNSKEQDLITNTIFESVSKIKNLFLIVKVHPNESNLSYYKKIAKKFNLKNMLILQSHNLYELIFISNIVIVSYSTVGIEAMRLRKPVIAMNMMGLHDDDPLINSKIPIIVRNKMELITSIKRCLNSEQIVKMLDDQEYFADKELGKFDGNSSLRIYNLILKLKNRKHTNV